MPIFILNLAFGVIYILCKCKNPTASEHVCTSTYFMHVLSSRSRERAIYYSRSLKWECAYNVALVIYACVTTLIIHQE